MTVRQYQYLFIYKTTNLINDKIYVGKHKTNNLNDGYIGCGVYYQSEALGNYPLHCSIRKYGYESFKREVLEFCEDQKQLNEREIFWIKELNSTNNDIGYNIGRGGEGGDNFTNHPNKEEWRQKNREWHLGRKQSKETKEKSIDTRRKNGRNIPTKETIEKRRQTIKLNPYHHSKEIIENWKRSYHKRPILICPYCNFQSQNSGNMKRWHFENCRYKQKIA